MPLNPPYLRAYISTQSVGCHGFAGGQWHEVIRLPVNAWAPHIRCQLKGLLQHFGRPALVAKYGSEQAYPDAYLKQVADLFLDELSRGQRGVYRRLGDRMDVDWSTARSRVMSAVRRGFLIWTGVDHEPAAHRPGGKPQVVPGSFEDRFAQLQEWVDLHGHARVPRTEIWEDAKLGSWVGSTRQRYRRGTLSWDRARRLAALRGWVWSTS